MPLALRPIRPDDEPFLFTLYASTRAEELAVAPWTDAQKDAFLRMQFAAQHRHYQQYDATTFDVIELDGVAVGRLYVRRAATEIGIVDIAFLPAYRGRGFGTGLLTQLIADAARAHVPLRIHVEKNNPALRLYERLGFTRIDDRGVYWHLELAPR